jgi:hypothetical protein
MAFIDNSMQLLQMQNANRQASQDNIDRNLRAIGDGFQAISAKNRQIEQDALAVEAKKRQEAMELLKLEQEAAAKGQVFDRQKAQEYLSGGPQAKVEMTTDVPWVSKVFGTGSRPVQAAGLVLPPQDGMGGLFQDTEATKAARGLKLETDKEDLANKKANTAKALAEAAKLRREGAPGLSGELEVPGYGQARTKEEAKDLRQAQADADDAVKLIDEIKALGTNVAAWDRGRINIINQKKKILAGKLRLPLTGPGAMTQDEYERLVDTMGDPSNLFSTEEIQMSKLDSLKDTLNSSVSNKFRVMGVQGYAQGPAPGFEIDPAVSAPAGFGPMRIQGQSSPLPFRPSGAPGISDAHASPLPPQIQQLSRKEKLRMIRGK